MNISFTTKVKLQLNQVLRPLNIKLDTWTAERREDARLQMLAKEGHFERPIFSPHALLDSKEFPRVLEELKNFGSRFGDFQNGSSNAVNYTFNNDFYSSPDTEILYTFIRLFRPHTIIEVGSGNSTRIIRQSLLDGELDCRLISIDPEPRIDVCGFSDELHLVPVESLDKDELFSALKADDILFIDSSHAIKTGNDVVALYLNIIPALPPDVLIHIHDIFLPYDYPKDWVLLERNNWNEQYLVQSLLTFSDMFEVLWAGYYLQKTLPGFTNYFPYMNNRSAKSLWLRKLK